MEDNIKEFPVKFKSKDGEGRFLKIVRDFGKCDHRKGPLLVDESLDHVECGQCGERLNPVYAVMMLARHETKWHHAMERYKDEMKRLDERQRTKCEHCGKQTRISRS